MTVDDATLAGLNEGQAAAAALRRDVVHALGDHVIERFVMGNRLKVILWEDHTAPVFAYQTWFGVGSRHERIGRTGIAHLFEHLMFKATATMGDGEFDQIMERHGAQTNAATWVDWTYYKEKLPAGSAELDLVIRLEADRMEHLVLSPEQLEAEREVVKNERLLRVDNDPDGTMYERLYAEAFTVHPYRWPTIGWMKDIEAITLDDCMAFYRAYYAPSNATVVLVGDFDSAEVLGLLQKYYGHMAAQELPPEDIATEPPQEAPRGAELQLAVATEKVVFGWHAPPATDDAQPALDVLNEILCGGDSSRLVRQLVHDLELASDVSGWTPSNTLTGLYEIAVSMLPGRRVEEAEVVLEAALEELRTGGVTERELTKAKSGIEAHFLRSIADVGARARGMGNAEVVGGDFRWFFRQLDRLRAVTADDVLAVARERLGKARRTAIIARPDGAAEAA